MSREALGTSTSPATGAPPTPAPRFSIIVPAYQAAATLAQTLDAIVAQRFVDWECAVVDDGSTDDTFAIASRFADADGRIRVIRQANQGTGGAYNAGVSATTGAYIVLCSADDLLLPEHLSRMSAFIDAEPEYDIYSSNGYRLLPNGSRKVAYSDPSHEGVHSRSLADVIEECFYSVGATYRREIFLRAGGYRTGVYGEDYDFWLRAMALGARHRYLPEPLSVFRVSATQKSAQRERVFQSDIDLVAGLRGAYRLSAAERAAIRDSIRERKRRIAKLRRQRRTVRAMVRRKARNAVFRLIGRERARRLWRGFRSRIRGRRRARS